MTSHELTLKEITKDNFYSICLLSVNAEQQNHVDSNALSMAEASFSDHAWMRGVYLFDEPIGFVMVEAQVEKKQFYLWRLMIDQRYQKRGFGKQAIALLVAELEAEFGAAELSTSVVPAQSGPKEFYEKLGFVATGKLVEDREVELKLCF